MGGNAAGQHAFYGFTGNSPPTETQSFRHHILAGASRSRRFDGPHQRRTPTSRERWTTTHLQPTAGPRRFSATHGFEAIHDVDYKRAGQALYYRRRIA